MKRDLEKGELECLVKRVLDAYVTDKLTPPVNKLMSAHRIARFVEADLSLGVDDATEPMADDRAPLVLTKGLSKWKPSDDDSKKISPGAVFELLERWGTLGFIVVERHPTRFVQYTQLATELPLPDIKAQRRASLKAERAKANA